MVQTSSFMLEREYHKFIYSAYFQSLRERFGQKKYFHGSNLAFLVTFGHFVILWYKTGIKLTDVGEDFLAGLVNLFHFKAISPSLSTLKRL